ncbi:MAG: hypothetical protein R2719_02460 [Micropruina sp.]
MYTPSKAAERARNWLAGGLVFALLAMGHGALAGAKAHAEETDPSPSAEVSASATPEEKAEPEKKPDESPKPSPTAEKSEPAAKSEAKPSEKPEPTALGEVERRGEADHDRVREAVQERAARVAAQAVPNAEPAREGVQKTTTDGAVYWIPATWVVGEDLVISGSGWKNRAGDAGSVVAVKLDNGGVSTTRTVVNPADGTVQANKTIYAVVQADAQGDWTLRLDYPTSANSTADWSAGESHTVNLLTGSLLAGDKVRSGSGPTTIAAKPAPEPSQSSSAPAPSSPAPSEPAPSSPAPSEPAPSSPAPVHRRRANRHPRPRRARPTASPATVIIVNPTVELGGVLRVQGAGWCHPTDGGSRIAIKIDQGAFAHLTTDLHANKTIWALIDASATDGSFDVELQLPDGTDAGAHGSAPAFTAGSHTLQLLTGSMKPGDISRSTNPGAFTVTGAPGPSEPAPSEPAPSTPAPSTSAPSTPVPSTSASPSAPAAGVEYADPANPSVTYTVPATVQPGEPIVVSGKGWLNTAGTSGSVLGVFLDAARSGDPNTVYTKRDVIGPDGTVVGDKRQQAVVQAAADGSWTATIPYPTAANAQLADGTWTEWAPGSTHQIRVLTGTLGENDVRRSLPADFTIAGTAPGGPGDPPSWKHDTVTAVGGATAWVQSEVATTSGSKIRIKGFGWTNKAGTGASTVAIKLNREGGQYSRTGSGVVTPGGTADPTTWKLLAPAGTPAHANVIEIPANGNFDIEIDAPAGLKAGQLLNVQFLSGRFGANDTVRNVTTNPLVVGGVPYTGDGDADQDVTCRPTSQSPVVTIVNPTVTLGGRLHVRGTGFCHPGTERGGSTIAIKIDEGAFSRLNDRLHSNRTIWQIVQARGSDGTFDVQLQLPDGTTGGANGSSPAFREGAHSLRLLTGSLKAGDTSRTIQSSEFVVGSYRPSGIPDPVEATEDLTSATRNGVTLNRTSSALTVTVPGARKGDWIYLNAYADNSPRDPFGATWFRADAGGRVVARLAGVTLPAGTSKLSVQSGNSGEVGRLLGWATLRVAAPPAAQQPSTVTTTVRRVVTTTTTAAGEDGSSAPTEVPAAPVERGSQLTGLSDGGATSVQSGTKVTVTLPKGTADGWVYVYIYSGASLTKAGWVQLSAGKSFTVDLKALDDGRHRIVAVAPDGKTVGWTSATKGEVPPPDGTTTITGNGQVPAPAGVPETGPTPAGGSLDPLLIGVAVLVLGGGLIGLRRLAVKPGK